MVASIETVEVRALHDSDPDVSYLAQKGFEDRLAAYTLGDFHYIGVVARVVVRFTLDGHPAGSYRLVELESGGLWGVESDSTREYLREIGGEQVSELRDMVEALAGVTVETFDAVEVEYVQPDQ